MVLRLLMRCLISCVQGPAAHSAFGEDRILYLSTKPSPSLPFGKLETGLIFRVQDDLLQNPWSEQSRYFSATSLQQIAVHEG